MTEEKEVAFLKDVLKKVTEDKPSILVKAWFNPVLWLVCAAILLTSYGYFDTHNSPAILVAGSVTVGIIIGAMSVIQNGAKTWPFLKNYIDVDAVKKRVGNVDE